MKELSLEQLLLKPRDGRADYFGTWQNEILKMDTMGVAARVSAPTGPSIEKFVTDSFNDAPGRITFVSYEEPVRDRERRFYDFLRELGSTVDSLEEIAAFEKSSWTTKDGRREMDPRDRIFSWKNELSSSDIQTIEGVADRFEMAERLTNE